MPCPVRRCYRSRLTWSFEEAFARQIGCLWFRNGVFRLYLRSSTGTVSPRSTVPGHEFTKSDVQNLLVKTDRFGKVSAGVEHVSVAFMLTGAG